MLKFTTNDFIKYISIPTQLPTWTVIPIGRDGVPFQTVAPEAAHSVDASPIRTNSRLITFVCICQNYIVYCIYIVLYIVLLYYIILYYIIIYCIYIVLYIVLIYYIILLYIVYFIYIVYVKKFQTDHIRLYLSIVSSYYSEICIRLIDLPIERSLWSSKLRWPHLQLREKPQ